MFKKILLFVVLIVVTTSSIGCQCEHEWEDATCKQAKTCTLCELSKGKPLEEHTWIEADCYDPKICKICGKRDGEPAGHMINDSICSYGYSCEMCGYVEKEPTDCIFMKGECQVCGYVDPDFCNAEKFGFQNMYGAKTFIEIEYTLDTLDEVFDRLDEGYFLCYMDYATLTFSNNALKQERWDRSDNDDTFFSKNSPRGGYVWSTNEYRVIDNWSINLYGYRAQASLSIDDIITYRGVPIVYCNFKTYYHENVCNGKYIPDTVIDWEKSPEIITVEENGYNRTKAKYYIKTEYLNIWYD